MDKKIAWISYDETTDIREVKNVGRGKIVAVIGDPIIGWGEMNRTVLALFPDKAETRENGGKPVFGVYEAPAHAKLTDEEIASLPHYSSIRAYNDAIGW